MIWQRIRDVVRRLRPPAAGGHIQGPTRTGDDSIPFLITPGYVSYDGGETWEES